MQIVLCVRIGHFVYYPKMHFLEQNSRKFLEKRVADTVKGATRI